MGAVPALFTDSYTVVASPTNATAVTICTVRGVSTSLPGQSVKLRAWVDITPDIDTSAVALAIIPGIDPTTTPIGGGGTPFVNGAQTNGLIVTAECETVPETISGGVFSIVAICSDATGASVVNAAHLEARVD